MAANTPEFTIYESEIAKGFFSIYQNRISSLLSNAIKTLYKEMVATSGCVWIIEGNTIVLAHAINIDADAKDPITLDKKDGLSGMVLSRNEGLYLNSMYENNIAPQLIETSINSLSSNYIGVPLRFQGQTIGVVTFTRKAQLLFTDRDLNWFQLSINLLSVFMESVLTAPHPTASINLYEQLVESIVPPINGAKAMMSGIKKESLSEGFHIATYDRILEFLRTNLHFVNAEEISRKVELSISSVRRYLNYLYAEGLVERQIQYSSVGRPTYLWRISID